MKIDLHTHGKLSKKAEFTLEGFREHVLQAKENGLSGFALTEHFNTTNFEYIYDTLDAHYSYMSDYYDVEGLRVFPGMEVDIQEVGHILLIGKRQDIKEINKFLVPYRAKESFIPFDSLIAFVRPYHVLKIGAHPFREAKGLAHLDKGHLKQLDALDLNATDLYHQGLKMKMELVIFASELQLPVVAGSDTHQSLQFGSVYNDLREEVSTIQELKDVIMRNAYDIEISPCLKEKVKAARLVKKTLKKSLSV
ncbi:PHP domain-containing protein [Alkalihalobacillus hemicellulosilyticus]|uniref:PHP domain-containing protein n=1 Tax=Halalkalibacter hemicellulosilyticusJCM 9152 TaxID=1236971 RepID=W4QCB6_9BACI|nr:PHP domain-containing protein [Halalkalibacter hemicellulosilyticus]GAE29597.1 hypothetical protein JCM9152_963 [Halalkalibacter hemicellulosilyticusJCM 9152]